MIINMVQEGWGYDAEGEWHDDTPEPTFHPREFCLIAIPVSLALWAAIIMLCIVVL